jgi:alkylated DNA repair dioxygenase AlkB
MDSFQASLFGAGEPQVRPGAPFRRIELDEASWVDHSAAWLQGADMLFELLAASVDWRQGRRRMYDRMVEDPRLSRMYEEGEELPHECLSAARASIGRRYGVWLGSPALNYYRDGNDSVAYHRDRELRHLDETLVAILTLGSARPFNLRPVGGGSSIQLRLASGDLLVMGGACQSRFEHCVPKVSEAGPRISATYRWSSGRGRTVSAPRAGRRPVLSGALPRGVPR